jgi:hypothetical protein
LSTLGIHKAWSWACFDCNEQQIQASAHDELLREDLAPLLKITWHGMCRLLALCKPTMPWVWTVLETNVVALPLRWKFCMLA